MNKTYIFIILAIYCSSIYVFYNIVDIISTNITDSINNRIISTIILLIIKMSIIVIGLLMTMIFMTIFLIWIFREDIMFEIENFGGYPPQVISNIKLDIIS